MFFGKGAGSPPSPPRPAKGKSHSMQQRRSPAAGGIFLFLGPVIGAVYGAARGEPVLWMMAGFGGGAVLATLIWIIDRRKG